MITSRVATHTFSHCNTEKYLQWFQFAFALHIYVQIQYVVQGSPNQKPQTHTLYRYTYHLVSRHHIAIPATTSSVGLGKVPLILLLLLINSLSALSVVIISSSRLGASRMVIISSSRLAASRMVIISSSRMVGNFWFDDISINQNVFKTVCEGSSAIFSNHMESVKPSKPCFSISLFT